MKNITLAIEEKVLDAVRRYAAEHDTSVNALVREYLSDIAHRRDRLRQAKMELLELSANSKARLGSNYKWNREELYGDRLLPRHQHSRLRRRRREG